MYENILLAAFPVRALLPNIKNKKTTTIIKKNDISWDKKSFPEDIILELQRHLVDFRDRSVIHAVYTTQTL